MICPNCGWSVERKHNGECPACHQLLSVSTEEAIRSYLEYLKREYPDNYNKILVDLYEKEKGKK